ncbi:hypothetical protein Tco_1010184 [Tanacetum coccineum]
MITRMRKDLQKVLQRTHGPRFKTSQEIRKLEMDTLLREIVSRGFFIKCLDEEEHFYSLPYSLKWTEFVVLEDDHFYGVEGKKN